MYDLAVNRVIIMAENFGWEPFVGAVLCDQGRIVEVFTREQAPAECREVVDGGGERVLMPGLVNGHCHGDMTLARGLGDGLTLGEQNRAFAGHNWFKAFLTGRDRRFSRQLTYCEALLSGTTFICENMYWTLGDDSAAAMVQTGIRGALVEDIRRSFDNQEDLLSPEELSRFRDGCLERGLVPVVGLPAEEDFDTPRLLKMKETLDGLGLRRTMHLAETDWRGAIIKEKFGATPVDYLAGIGFLGPSLLGSHVVRLSAAEVGLLKAAGTAVVNTPLCEMKIADGVAPIPEMLRQGVPVCLGTDGALWNNSNDIFREMKAMALLHSLAGGPRALGPAAHKKVLSMATAEGARAFGVEGGLLEKGLPADFILVDVSGPHIQPLRLGKYENVGSALVYCATGADVRDVFIGGRRVVAGRLLQTCDLRAIIAGASEALARVTDLIG